MTDEAREAAWIAYRGDREPRFIRSRLAFQAGVDWGIAEGIRRARAAVIKIDFWEEEDAVAVEDALDALETT